MPDDEQAKTKAIEGFSSTIARDPNNAEAYFNRGRLYDSRGDLEKAIADYTKAIELKPDHAEAYVQRGAVYAEKGEPGKAASDYQKYRSLSGSK